MGASVEHPQLPLGLTLRDSARFENFHAGAGGEAVAALQAVAGDGGESPVYLAGLPGTGKSHLLQAACHAAGNGARATAYLPMKDLQALPAEMLEGLEHMALVCVDDIDVIAGQREWETALFNLFNRMRAAGHSLVFAASGKPAECGFELPDLVSRLGWGLTYTLKPLDETQLLAALALRARGRRIRSWPSSEWQRRSS